MQNTPKISVIMPVYNGQEYLAECIDSIIAQTFDDFEFIIVNDASTDNTAKILEEYALKDNRIHVLHNQDNKNIGASLNRALEATRAPLIARMDADDVSHPTRLKKQYDFMQSNPRIDICGTFIEIYETGQKLFNYYKNDAMQAYLLFNSCLAHPTVMYRKDVVLNLGCYDGTMSPTEDYDLWSKMLLQGNSQFANIPEILLRHRAHPNMDRSKYTAGQNNLADIVRNRLLTHLGITPTPEELQIHMFFAEVSPISTLKKWEDVKDWKNKLLSANEKCQLVNSKELASILNRKCENIFVFYWSKTIKALCHKHIPNSIWIKLANIKKFIQHISS